MFRNICLIGMPYSGKTYLSRKLYRPFNKGLIDTDDLIKLNLIVNYMKLFKALEMKNF